MSEHRDRIFVSIAVSKPDGGLVQLPGAITASERMADWADANGYIPLRINDVRYPEVTIDLLRGEITTAIHEVTKRAVLQRLVIFFAGHGAALGIDDQNWLLSNWKARSTEAVNVGSLLRALEYHGPRQVSIIGDACQEFSATFMEVRGGPLLDTTDEERQSFELDKFFPVDAGSKAFMIKAADAEEAFCLFTEVMLDALAGDAPTQYFEIDAAGRHVTSQKIAQFLTENLAREAGKYGVTMSPRPRPGFWSDRNYFSAADAGPGVGSNFRGAGADMHLKSASPRSADNRRSASRRSVKRVELTPQRDDRDAARSAAAALERHREAAEQAYAAAANVKVRDHFETGCGICFTGAPIVQVQASRGELSQDGLPPDWYRLQLSDATNPRLWADVVVDLADGNVATACVVQNFITAMHVFDKDGVNVLHRPLNASSRVGGDVIALLAKLHAGTLTGTEVVDAAARLRLGKHKVLTMGAVAAQFYDSVRDNDGLRSIASHYALREQPIPLDIVLYGGGRLFADGDILLADVAATDEREPRSEIERKFGYTYQATKAITRHPVAGRVPWMRQAWSAVATAECDSSAEAWRKQALAVLPHLGAGPFTLVGEGGREAIIALSGVTETFEDPRPLSAMA